MVGTLILFIQADGKCADKPGSAARALGYFVQTLHQVWCERPCSSPNKPVGRTQKF